MAIPTLKDQRVVVIGGTSNIGLAVAEAALADGARVFVGSSRQANVDTALAKLGQGAGGAAVDANDEVGIASFLARAGTFDHLVFTAGDWGPHLHAGLIADMNLEVAKGSMGVRYWGAVAAVKHALGRIAEHGSITLTSGVMSFRPTRAMPLATSICGAIEHLAKGLAVELAPIRVNAVVPGMTLSDRTAANEAVVQARVGAQLLPRPAAPEEMAQAYLYLMRCGFTTGQVVVVDGGLSLT